MSIDAWKASLRGDHSRAGDLYRESGKLEKALASYLKGGDYRLAAEVEVELKRYQEAVRHMLQAGDKLGAARILKDSKHYLQAARLFAEIDNYSEAAAMAIAGKDLVLAAQFHEKLGRYFKAGRLYQDAGQTGRALLVLEKALKEIPSDDVLNPEEMESYRDRRIVAAGIFREAEEFGRAGEIFERAGNLTEAAACYKSADRVEKALEIYRKMGNTKAIQELMDDGEGTPAKVRAEVLAARGDTTTAARLFLESGDVEKAAELYEQGGNPLEAARVWREIGDWERAGNLFFRAEAYSEAALCFQQGHLYALAREAFEKDENPSAASRMALEAGLWERAYDLSNSQTDRNHLIRKWQAVPSGSEDRDLARLMLARAFLDQGQPELADECLREIRGEPSDEPWLPYIKARIYQAIGQDEDASREYRKVLARDIGFQDARNRLDSLKKGEQRKTSGTAVRYKPKTRLFEDGTGTWYSGEDRSLECGALFHRLDRLPDGTVRKEILAFSPKILALRHRGVLALRDVVRENETVVHVHEGFEGKLLSRILEGEGALSLFKALDRVRTILEVLQEAHGRQIFHCALTPHAILIGGEGAVKVLGLGLPPRLLLEEGRAAADLVPYLPPEFAESENRNARWDLFSVGALFYRFLSGNPPPPRLTPALEPFGKARMPDLEGVPATVRPILTGLLDPEPGRRYQRAEHVLRDLDALALPPGALIAERYEILEELGRGGMGQVFRVKDTHLDEVVALKTLRYGSGVSERERTRFLREIKLTRKITHPNVIRVFDLGQFRDLTFLTMEYLPGQTLTHWITAGKGRKASLGEKIFILKQIANGLAEAHRLGIVHRDLKPQNVILTPDGTPKLLDFGIAFAQEGAEITQEGHFVGSPKYVSPEQIQGRTMDARSDVYSFGLLAYLLLTGKETFGGDNPTAILMRHLKEKPAPPSSLVRVPESLDDIVMKCLEKDPDKRPPSLRSVVQVLEGIA